MSYIVINDTAGTATVLHKDADLDLPRGGVLFNSEKVATEFPTREAANRAVMRTEGYYARTDSPRHAPSFRVFRLQPEALAK